MLSNKVFIGSRYKTSAQQQGFHWFRVQNEKFQLAQQQGFHWFRAQNEKFQLAQQQGFDWFNGSRYST